MKKYILIIILITSLLNIVGCTSNKTNLGKSHEESVTNGLNEEIGTRLVVDSNDKDITDKNIIEFYNEVVKNNDYKYITVNLGDGEGLLFNADNTFIKGNVDENGMISKTKEFGEIKDNKIIYQKN